MAFLPSGNNGKIAHGRTKIKKVSPIRTVTVGFGISPNQFPKEVADYHRRKGISPCPEDICKYTFYFETKC